MLTQRKSRIFLTNLVVLFLITFVICSNAINVEASRRTPNLGNIMKESDIMQWTLELNEKTFHIYVNRNNETVIIRGTVEDEEEKARVDEYMMMKSPKTYQIFSEIDIVN
jgi:hypothetical protein